jgi:hypothetical protein
VSYEIKWNDGDKKILQAVHEVADGAPVWLLPPTAPGDVVTGGETPAATPGARLLVLAGDLAFAAEVELRTAYPAGAPAGGLALPGSALKTLDRHAARTWPAAPDHLLDGPAGPTHETLTIAGTDLSDAADVLSHATDDPTRSHMSGVQVTRGVGAGATDGHRATVPVAAARGTTSMDGGLFLPSGLVHLLRVIEARDATVERWRDAAGALRCQAEGLRWRAAWVTPAGAEPDRNPIGMTPQLIGGPVFASATLAQEQNPDWRGERTRLRKAVAQLAKWARKHAAGNCAVQVRLGATRVEFWGATREPEWVEVVNKQGEKVEELQVYEDELLGAIGHPDRLPAWSPLGPVPWAEVAPQYLLDALDLASPLREVRLLGADQVDAVQAPIVFYGERQASVVMPLRPGELEELRVALRPGIAA